MQAMGPDEGAWQATLESLSKDLEEALAARVQAEEEAEELRERLSMRSAEVQALHEKVHSAQEMLDVLNSRNSACQLLQQELDERQQEVQDLKGTLREKAQQERKLQSRLLEEENTCGALRKQLAERSQTAGRMLILSIEVVRLKQGRDRMAAEISAKDEELSKLRQALSVVPYGTLEAVGRSGEDRVGQEPPPVPAPGPQQDAEELRSLYEGSVKELDKELEKLRRELSDVHSEVAGQRKQQEQAEQQRAALQEELQATKQAHLRAQGQLEEKQRLEADMERLSLGTDTEEKLKDKDQQIASLLKELSELKGKLEFWGEYERCQEQLGNANKTVESMKAHIKEVEESTQNLRKALQKVKKEKKEQGEELEKLRKQLSEVTLSQSDIEPLQAELRRLYDELEREQREKRDIVELNEIYASQIQDLESGVDNRLNDLQMQLTKEMEAHNKTKQSLFDVREEKNAAAKRAVQFQEVVSKVAFPDRRQQGHQFQLRLRESLLCNGCKSVQNGLVWKCQRCIDVFCIECVASKGV